MTGRKEYIIGLKEKSTVDLVVSRRFRRDLFIEVRMFSKDSVLNTFLILT